MKGGILCSTQMEFKAITNGRENAKVEKPRGGGIYINSCNRWKKEKMVESPTIAIGICKVFKQGLCSLLLNEEKLTKLEKVLF